LDRSVGPAGRRLGWRSRCVTKIVGEICRNGRKLYWGHVSSDGVLLLLTRNSCASKWCFVEFALLGKAIFSLIEAPKGETYIVQDWRAGRWMRLLTAKLDLEYHSTGRSGLVRKISCRLRPN
jgi:hypothetical protein